MQARLRILRAITATEGEADFRVLKLFYLEAIRSIVDYVAPLLATTTPIQMDHLEKLQNAALGVMLGTPLWT